MDSTGSDSNRAIDGSTTAGSRDDAPVVRARNGWRGAIVAEFKSRPFGYLVLIGFAVAGPIVAHYLLPQAPAGLGFVGGIALGAYAALCAVPQKFL